MGRVYILIYSILYNNDFDIILIFYDIGAPVEEKRN